MAQPRQPAIAPTAGIAPKANRPPAVAVPPKVGPGVGPALKGGPPLAGPKAAVIPPVDAKAVPVPQPPPVDPKAAKSPVVGAAPPKKARPPPAAPKQGFGLFQEKFFEIRKAAFQTGCIAVIAHFLIAFSVVVGLFQITIGAMYYSECPANDFIPQFLIIMGGICILDMALAVLAVIPLGVSAVFFYTLVLIRIGIIAMIFYGFTMLGEISNSEMTRFCVDILTDTLQTTLIIFAVLICIYVVLLILNIITAIALMRYKK